MNDFSKYQKALNVNGSGSRGRHNLGCPCCRKHGNNTHKHRVYTRRVARAKLKQEDRRSDFGMAEWYQEILREQEAMYYQYLQDEMDWDPFDDFFDHSAFGLDEPEPLSDPLRRFVLRPIRLLRR